MKKLLVVPKFKSEEDEWKFWDKLDLSDYFEPADAKFPLFPNLKPTTRSISIRLPEYIIARVKIQANRLDLPYQTLIKQYIAKNALLEEQR